MKEVVVSPEASFEDVIAYYPIGATINIGLVEDKLGELLAIEMGRIPARILK